ncbi:unnamed protein product [Camellia sinensis]
MTKKAKTSAKEDVKEQKVQVQTAEVKAVTDDSSKTIVIEHWRASSKQCNSFKTQAIQVKNGLESGLSGVNVLVNPEKVDKNAIKFKTKPLEHMDLMRRVYEGATASGKYAWTPGAAFEPVATNDGTSPMDEENCEDSSGLPPFQPATQREHTVHHTSAPENDTPASVHAASSAINADDTPTSGRSKRKFSRTTHPQWKKGQSEGASLLASSMENLASSVKLQQREVHVRHDYGDSTQELIDKCMRRLYSLEGLDPQDPLIVFGLTVLDNPANQAIMVRIPTDAAVISWLRMKKSRSMGGPSAGNSGMGGGWF